MTCINSLADSLDSWADLAAGFVAGVVCMALVNVLVSASMRWW